jgi:hypothetical protein
MPSRLPEIVSCCSRDWQGLGAGREVEIKKGCVREGRRGVVVFGSILLARIWWTAVVWDGSDEPEWCESSNLVALKEPVLLCSVLDCDNKHYAKGKCRIHYNQQYQRKEKV